MAVSPFSSFLLAFLARDGGKGGRGIWPRAIVDDRRGDNARAAAGLPGDDERIRSGGNPASMSKTRFQA